MMFLIPGLILLIVLSFLFFAIIFFKNKKSRKIFIALTVFFGLLPFLLFMNIERRRLNEQKKYVGYFVSENEEHFIHLNKNLTWKSDNKLFECSLGSWEYVSTEDFDYLELKGDCLPHFGHMQIWDSKPDSFSFRLDQHSAQMKPIIKFIRRSL